MRCFLCYSFCLSFLLSIVLIYYLNIYNVFNYFVDLLFVIRAMARCGYRHPFISFSILCIMSVFMPAFLMSVSAKRSYSAVFSPFFVIVSVPAFWPAFIGAARSVYGFTE